MVRERHGFDVRTCLREQVLKAEERRVSPLKGIMHKIRLFYDNKYDFWGYISYA
jgi:hypothetical protein